ncbi:iron-containing alcohol dehydrogenase [Ponticoccus sp. SC2-23]|uniref:iron-containing alcohol dehydrogenase n=1 Tax=Alexandriicola marinus TaxID=2081710 RepID=UPI000FD9F34E|nr:iron-containing alcohol dehydrogenase [Alexandriicola marinus]MBM1220444.1 iron-containing alcohol dehydrogenase [Ponticoccus sp. SC6-9]MBM1225130.1 iron-containing alcohol dehydrogenase [Ponticoccus sp. SC6-15]MBM1228644.1 iron-containing alcohol dehydrogenase [Ponticoccus sp. SC6-38]MBM1233719.1 iron-containing alcohol dehydrogenase [Ponticoccus sp. SC6-45]MBM1239145.1 iron-containing alcohol dehydrogenase [Ponticoccus sp. SC6-49]MBM1242927.1 iron-containing alcohol dehydrogenase [Pontic
MSPTANWSYPTAIRFGAGRIAEIGEACRAAGMSKPLLVTDRGLKDMEITRRTLDLMETAGLGSALFADVDPNPNDGNVEEGLRVYREGGFDGVIAFGGGSGLDLAKTLAFMAGQTRPLWDFEDIGDWWTRADPAGIHPIVAVPTTAGTGSEVGRASVITNSATHEKKIIFHPKMLPSVVICDPELTVGMPKFITAGTGLDAFAHCVEAFSSPHYHPMSQGIALEGMRLVIDNLPRAYADGTDLEARANMMSAAAMGATAFQKGLGAIHALSHPIGAHHHTHHGTTNAVCMPAVLAFNAPTIRDRFDRAAGYLGIEGGFDGFCAFVDTFNDSFGIPKTLSGLGVTDADIDRLVADALRDPSTGGNPVEMTEENTRALFDAIL